MIRPKRYLLKVRGHELQFGDRTLIMGVLNVTPDSFSDGGRFSDPDRAVARALELEEQGADLIDIGAESTKPGAKPVSEAEELRRLIPVLKRLEGRLTIPISVDTYKSGVAAKALEYGVAFINDPSNLTIDPRLANVVAAQDAGLILNHMRGTPETWAKLGNLPHPAETVLTDLEHSVNRAQKALVDRQKIIIDPGLGFGKRGDQNWEILSRLGRLRELDLPILVGPSRKAFLGQKSNDALQQDFATAAAVTGAILAGAHMVRVHKVAALACTVQAADALLRTSPEEVREQKEKRRTLQAGDRRPYGIGESSDLPGPRDWRPGERAAASAPDAASDLPPSGRRPAPERGGEELPGRMRPAGPASGFDRAPERGGERGTERGGERLPYVKRPRFGGPEERGGGDQRPFARRPPSGERDEEAPGRGDGPYRRPRFDGDRPPAGRFGKGAGGGPPFRPARSAFSDRPTRPFRDPEGGKPGPRGGDWPKGEGAAPGGDGTKPPKRFGPRTGDRGESGRGPGDGPGGRPFRPRFPKPPGFRRG
ncbi:MAG: dihydropteroate synthase [Acidobacteriota bacterium]